MSQSAQPLSALEIGDLLLPKLSPPRPTANLIPREHLLKQMDQALVHDLTLLSASAGFGKTTLLSAWAASCPVPVAWLSLEEEDNDPLRFWSYIIAALQTREPGMGETALSMLQSPQSPALTTILTSLINDLAARQEKMVLALDDFHVIDNPDLVASFQFLLEHLPARFHLILAGRNDPELALSRWRARGQIVELRDRDLRFTRAEVATFLSHAIEMPLAEAEVDLLTQRTEGWIAGLQLAALAMRAREDAAAFIQHLSGNQRFILEYLQEEVLERQPQEVQDFLLHTSILTRLNASLCQAVLAEGTEQESQQLLFHLEKANLFLVSLDEERHWYRLHSLLRDVLQAQLHALTPACIPLLHQRAAHWYAQQGATHEAILHALAGEDYAFAADLMETYAEHMCLNGEAVQVWTWFAQLPDTVLLAHAPLALTTALQELLSTYPAPDTRWQQAVSRAEITMERMEMLLEGMEAAALSEAVQHQIQNRLGLLRCWIALRAAIYQRQEEQERRLYERMQVLARDENAIWKMLPIVNLDALTKNLIPHLPLLSALKEQAEQENHFYETAWLLIMLGDTLRQAGQPRQAAQNYHEALQRLRQLGKARSMFGFAHLYLAELSWSWNQLEETLAYLEIARQFAQLWQHIQMHMQSSHLAIPVLLVLGRQTEAEERLAEIEHLIQQHPRKSLRDMVETARARIWLAQGKLDTAAQWIEQRKSDPSFQQVAPYSLGYHEYLAMAQVLLALQRNDEALSLLAWLLTCAEQQQDIWNSVQILALQVMALSASNGAVQARQVALRLLQMAEPADYLRIYLDAGTSMRQVLQDIWQDAQISSDLDVSPPVLAAINTLLTAFAQQAKRSIQEVQPVIEAKQLTLPSLPDPLTAREREVLPLLAQGQTNQEIADHLVISFATAKKHVANILSKLGAENRVQAVARAREYGLL